MKRFNLKALSVLILVTSLQQTASAGSYVGGLLGFTNIDIAGSSADDSSSSKVPFGRKGFNAGLLAGYEFLFDRLSLAAEVNGLGYSASGSAIYSDSDSDDPDDNGSVRSILNYSYGLNILPGYYIASNVKLFALLGYERAGFEFKGKDSDDSYKETANQNGFTYGLGSEIKLNDSFSLRFQYSYADLGNWKFNPDPSDPDSDTTKFEFSTNQFNLGIVYHFG